MKYRRINIVVRTINKKPPNCINKYIRTFKKTKMKNAPSTDKTNVPKFLRKLPNFRDNLRIALRGLGELAKERKIRVAMPTKMPQYDDELAELMIKAKVSVMASIAYSQYESAIMSYGFTVEKRLDEILKFAKSGVNANIYIATDITRGLEHLQDDAKQAMDFFEKYKEYLGLQFLDMRIMKKSLAPTIAGGEWDDLKYSPQMNLFHGPGRWAQSGNNALHALYTHEDFLNIIGNNLGKVRLCSTHVIEEEKRCGRCFMDKK